ncbi:selenide, water dikinase [Reticulomyxa filosa]|uniref:Selenide, water dikinase n=1 Tax=Reticulomyxa filosa TaxID=46433 RepID=X6M3Y5_RETFI|nr:selenide, water dikinase [Reticulomyxa filosa]|eukprot:ETO07740.1 selenide, water dikinase [Reticulomyxa filosa]
MSSIWEGTEKFRLVLLGGGHTNTQVLKYFRRENVPKHIELILVSDYESAFYSGLCPAGVAEMCEEKDFSIEFCICNSYCVQGVYLRALIKIALFICILLNCSKALGWEFIQCQVTKIEASKQKITGQTSDKKQLTIKYDLLCVDIGSRNVGHALPGVQEYSVGTRPLKQLLQKIDSKLSQCLEDINKQSIIIVTVGGGVAGCELTMCMLARVQNRTRQRKDFQVHSIVVTNKDGVCADEPESLREAVTKVMLEKKLRYFMFIVIIVINIYKWIQ